MDDEETFIKWVKDCIRLEIPEFNSINTNVQKVSKVEDLKLTLQSLHRFYGVVGYLVEKIEEETENNNAKR